MSKLSKIILDYFPFLENDWHLTDLKAISYFLEDSFTSLFGKDEFIIRGENKELSITAQKENGCDILITYKGDNYKLYSEAGKIILNRISDGVILFEMFYNDNNGRTIVSLTHKKDDVIVKIITLNNKEPNIVTKFYVIDDRDKDDKKYSLEFINTKLGENYYFKIITPYGDGVKEISSKNQKDNVLDYFKEMFEILEETYKKEI